MTFAVFASIVLIHLVAAMTPGPSFVVSVRTAAAEGLGVATGLALGFALGAALWATAAMVGIAVLFELVPALFIGLKVIGGAVLIYIAYHMWRHASRPLETDATPGTARTIWGAVKFGFVTFASNPKTAVFFGAVFVGLVPADTTLSWRIGIVVAIFANEFLWYVLVARVFSLAQARAGYIKLKSKIDRVFGTLLALFGLKIALT